MPVLRLYSEYLINSLHLCNDRAAVAFLYTFYIAAGCYVMYWKNTRGSTKVDYYVLGSMGFGPQAEFPAGFDNITRD